MKIYTKTGDSGKTSLIGGTKVPKHHIRVDAYGMIDELNVHIGLIADQDIELEDIKFLRLQQHLLFVIGSNLASDPVKSKMQVPAVKPEDVEALEKQIDTIEETVSPLKNFILPGGHITISFIHLARVVCRRSERTVSLLSENEKVDPIILQYLNRLSDYLFMLARKISLDLDIEEILWKP